MNMNNFFTEIRVICHKRKVLTTLNYTNRFTSRIASRTHIDKYIYRSCFGAN